MVLKEMRILIKVFLTVLLVFTIYYCERWVNRNSLETFSIEPSLNYRLNLLDFGPEAFLDNVIENAAKIGFQDISDFQAVNTDMSGFSALADYLTFILDGYKGKFNGRFFDNFIDDKIIIEIVPVIYSKKLSETSDFYYALFMLKVQITYKSDYI